jgi:hypothetical protein
LAGFDEPFLSGYMGEETFVARREDRGAILQQSADHYVSRFHEARRCPIPHMRLAAVFRAVKLANIEISSSRMKGSII